MILKFKINLSDIKTGWIGWFGEDVMKLKLNSDKENIDKNLLDFINKDLGIKFSDMKILNCDVRKRLVTIEFPDIAWELFLSAIEK